MHYKNLCVADPGCLSRIRIFSIQDPGSRIQGQKDSGSASKNSSILPQKIVSKLSEIWSGLFILIFYPSRIPDPMVKKAPDPGYWIRIRNTEK